jgi:hypothetical protein
LHVPSSRVSTNKESEASNRHFKPTTNFLSLFLFFLEIEIVVSWRRRRCQWKKLPLSLLSLPSADKDISEAVGMNMFAWEHTSFLDFSSASFFSFASR